MRISDWSSDVCSSDLLLSGQHKGGVRRLATANFQFRTFPNKSLESEAFAAGRTAVFCHSARRKTVENENGRYARRADTRWQGRPQIGRASCRERVGQSV